MRARALLLGPLLCLLPLALPGASHQAWALGSQSQETVPYFELDPEYALSAPLGPGGGAWEDSLFLRAGLSDDVELGLGAVAGLATRLGASGKLKLAEPGVWPLDLALMAEAGWSQAQAWQGTGGLVLARDLGQFELAADLLWAGAGQSDLRLGLRSPYLLTSLRMGLEGRALLGPWGSALVWAPQAYLDLPGDISLNLAGLLPTDGSGAYSLRLALAVELFPNP